MRKLEKSLAVVAVWIVLALHPSAQSPSSSQIDRSPFSSPNARDRNHDDGLARMEEQQGKSRNAERQKRLVDDTNKLLSLATELKTQVDKTDKNTLSIDVIKKTEEIEKLAHSVRERMKG